MRTAFAFALVGVTLLSAQVSRAQAPKADSASGSAAATYEHLANAIIAIEATEDELVRSILIGYHTAAQMHLKAAIRDEKGRVGHLEAAAAEIANIANEGDKSIQAIRQRLAKAGHTHNTDSETKDDYIWITNKEKKGLVAIAGKIARAGADAKADDLKALGTELESLFLKAVAPE